MTPADAIDAVTISLYIISLIAFIRLHRIFRDRMIRISHLMNSIDYTSMKQRCKGRRLPILSERVRQR